MDLFVDHGSDGHSQGESVADPGISRRKRRRKVIESDSEAESGQSGRIGVHGTLDMFLQEHPSSPTLPISKPPRTQKTGKAVDPIEIVESSEEEEKVPPSSANALWTELHAPPKSADLAMNKKKVKEIRDAILNAVSGIYRVILVTGPIGCGKSTAVRLLASELDLNLCEWETPVTVSVRDGSDHVLYYTSVLNAFDEFIEKAGRYNSVVGDKTAHVLFVDDLPLLFDARQRDAFARTMRKCIKGGVTRQATAPVIIIVGDDNMRVFPSDVLSSPRLLTLSVRAAAKTFVKTALKRIATSEGISATSYINEACELCNGDVRAAVLDMQLRYMGKKAKKTSAKNDRDGQLSLMHAMGRILHAKRVPSEHGRGELEFSPEHVVESFVGQHTIAMRLLHANSVEFLARADPSVNQLQLLEDCADVTHVLSDADVMNRWQWAGDTWLNEAAMLSAVRGWLNYNHQPRPRQWIQLTVPQKHREQKNRLQNLLYTYTTSCSSTTTLAIDVLHLFSHMSLVKDDGVTDRELPDDPIEE